MPKKAYIGVPSYKVIVERTMIHSSGTTWSWGMNTTNEVNWTKGETYVCDVTIDGVTYSNVTFSPDVGASWFAVYPETGTTLFEVYVATNNQFYDYGLGLDTTTSHTILLSTGDFNGIARKIKKGYVGIPALMNVPNGRSKYNNMDLPTVPQWDSTTYPYAYISYSANEGYRFLVCNVKLQYVLAQGKCTPVSNASYMYSTLWNKTSGTWDSWSSVKSATANSTYLTAPSWANTAIPYSDSSNTLLSATEPTVLYEEKEVGVARKIKKAYIGIGGVARPCWSGGEVVYYGAITPLSQARERLAATHVGNYALFGGGYNSSNMSGVVDAYDTKLTLSKPTALSTARMQAQATHVGDYALFGGGAGMSATRYNRVDCYNKSLVRSTSALSSEMVSHAATHVGDYALFGGGIASTIINIVNAFNTSLTRTTPAALGSYKRDLCATHVGDYAIFSSGQGNSYQYLLTMDAYSKSLTKTTIGDSSVCFYTGAATHVGDYALFGGGSNSSGAHGAVNAYNKSLTRNIPTSLSYSMNYIKATCIENFALFEGGGYALSSSIPNTANAYDESLTRTIPTPLGAAIHSHAATHVGDYALFGGGSDKSGTYQSGVYAYVVT